MTENVTSGKTATWPTVNQTLTFANISMLYAMPEIPHWISWGYFSLLCMSVFLGIPGNALTALAYANIQTKTSCDWYILFVALFDLVSCSFKNTSFFLEHLNLWTSGTSSEYCRFTAWISQTMVCASIFLFALIAIDRYIKICHSDRQTITPKGAKNLTLALTLLNMVLALPCVVIFENISRGVCQVKNLLLTNKVITAYYSAMFLLFLMMMLTVIVCYIRIAIKVRQARKVGVIEITNMAAAVKTDNSREDSSNHFTSAQVSGQCHRKTPASSSRLQACLPAPEHQRDSLSRFTTQSTGASSNGIYLIINSSTAGQEEGAASQYGLAALSRLQDKPHSVRQRRSTRVTALLFVVTAIFIVSWLPPYAAMIMTMYVGYSPPFTAWDLSLMLYGPNIYVINTFSNPIVYVIFSSTYRKHVAALGKRAKNFFRFCCQQLV